MKFAVQRSEISFIPRTKGKYIIFEVTPRKCQRPSQQSFWMYKLNTSLVQIPAITGENILLPRMLRSSRLYLRRAMCRVVAMLGNFQFNNWSWALCTQFAFFVHPIYAWKQIHAWMQICSEWNEDTLDGSQCLDLMYGQALGWSYVIPPGTQRFGKQRWRQTSECRHVQERILIPCCICSWHARDLQISTQIALPRPKSHGSCSQIKAHYSDLVWGRRKGQHIRRWKDYCWCNNNRISSSYVAAQHVA